MKKNILLIVDAQAGFMKKAEMESLKYKISELLSLEIFDIIIATKFMNSSYSSYHRYINWEKMQNPQDQKLIKSVQSRANLVIEKSIYSCINADFIQKITQYCEGSYPENIYILGVDTDCCVLKIAVDLFEVNIRPIILSDYCFSNGGLSSHEAGLLCMKRLIGRKQIHLGSLASRLDLPH